MDEETVRTILKHYFRLFPNADSIAIANLEQYIYYEPSRHLDVQIRPGDTFKRASTTYKAILKQKRIKELHQDSNSSITYYKISEPIVMDGTVVGAMTAIYPLKTSTFSLPYLTVRTHDRWVPIYLDDVIFLEAYNRKTFVSSSKYKGTHRNNLTELEALLLTNNFIRYHRSYIIKLHQVKEIHPDSHSTFI